MKTWQIEGIWENKTSKKEVHITFLVVCPRPTKKTDPLKILNGQYDFDGMTYKMGKITEIDIETVFVTHASQIIEK
jgi:hypothetical protein